MTVLVGMFAQTKGTVPIVLFGTQSIRGSTLQAILFFDPIFDGLTTLKWSSLRSNSLRKASNISIDHVKNSRQAKVLQYFLHHGGPNY